MDLLSANMTKSPNGIWLWGKVVKIEDGISIDLSAMVGTGSNEDNYLINKCLGDFASLKLTNKLNTTYL